MSIYIDFDELLYLKLKPSQQEIFEKGNLTPEHARIFLDIPSDEVRELVINETVRKDYTPIQTKAYYFSLVKKEKIKGNKLPTQIFINTIDNVVEKITSKGVNITSMKTETPNYFEYLLRIPK